MGINHANSAKYMDLSMEEIQFMASNDIGGNFSFQDCPNPLKVSEQLPAHPDMMLSPKGWVDFTRDIIREQISRMDDTDLLEGTFDFNGEKVRWWLNTVGSDGKLGIYRNIRFEEVSNTIH